MGNVRKGLCRGLQIINDDDDGDKDDNDDGLQFSYHLPELDWTEVGNVGKGLCSAVVYK